MDEVYRIVGEYVVLTQHEIRELRKTNGELRQANERLSRERDEALKLLAGSPAAHPHAHAGGG